MDVESLQQNIEPDAGIGVFVFRPGGGGGDCGLGQGIELLQCQLLVPLAITACCCLGLEYGLGLGCVAGWYYPQQEKQSHTSMTRLAHDETPYRHGEMVFHNAFEYG